MPPSGWIAHRAPTTTTLTPDTATVLTATWRAAITGARRYSAMHEARAECTLFLACLPPCIGITRWPSSRKTLEALQDRYQGVTTMATPHTYHLQEHLLGACSC